MTTSKTQSNTTAIILAAGKGTRMKSDLPKVMHCVHGTPLIGHVVSCVEASGVCNKPVVVVSNDHELVQDYLQDRAVYAIQTKQLGTGHAAASAKDSVLGNEDIIIVLYGDHPYLKPESIQTLVQEHHARKNTITAMTFTVPNFEEDYACFAAFGKIVRDEQGNFVQVVEKKDCTDQQTEIKELNPGYACYDATWFWHNIATLKNDNAQEEYYLTDLFGLASQQQRPMSTISIDPKEAMGVNTKEDLARAERQ